MEAQVSYPSFVSTPGNELQSLGIRWKFFGNTLRVNVSGLVADTEVITVKLNSREIGPIGVTEQNSQVRIPGITIPRTQRVSLNLGLSENKESYSLVRKFKSCKSIWSLYNGGIARSALEAKDEASGKKDATVFPRLYLANSKLDRDFDGVICER
jgi:hypothetical protein